MERKYRKVHAKTRKSAGRPDRSSNQCAPQSTAIADVDAAPEIRWIQMDECRPILSDNCTACTDRLLNNRPTQCKKGRSALSALGPAYYRLWHGWKKTCGLDGLTGMQVWVGLHRDAFRFKKAQPVGSDTEGENCRRNKELGFRGNERGRWVDHALRSVGGQRF